MADSKKISTLVRSSLVVAVLLLIGRLSGFAREWFIAKAGASEATDIAIVLLTFPDLMVSLLLGGGLSAALVPAFKRLEPGEDAALLLEAARVVAGLFLFLALVIAVFAPWVLGVLAPGLPDSARAQHANLFRLITGALPLAALSGVVVALLNAKGRFAIGASGTLIFNLSVITSLLFANLFGMPAAIAIGVLSGALMRLTVQSAGLWPDWTLQRPDKKLIDRALVGRFFSSFGFITLLATLPPLARAISSLDDAGALSLFNFAHKLVELPMGVVIGSITTVLLPRLAADFARSGVAAAQANLSAGIHVALGVSIGIAIPAAVFSDTLVQLAFFSASFSLEQVHTLSLVATIGFLSLPFQGLLYIYASAFAASGYSRPLVLTGVIMLGAIAVLAPIARSHLGLMGVMAAYGGTYVLGVSLLSWQVRSLFGAKTFSHALQNAPKTLILPALVALVVAILGNYLGDGLVVRALWASASFIAFVLCVALFDVRLRTSFAKSARRDSE